MKGEKTYPYLKDESEQEEFNELFDISSKLFSKRRSTRQKAADELVNIGKKAVRPLVFALHCEYVSDGSDEEYISMCDEVEAILVRIGRDALPDLEDFATNKGCLIPINEFAQDTIFAVMGLEGEDRKKVCHHRIEYLYEKGEEKVLKCACCGAEFEYEEDE